MNEYYEKQITWNYTKETIEKNFGSLRAVPRQKRRKGWPELPSRGNANDDNNNNNNSNNSNTSNTNN